MATAFLLPLSAYAREPGDPQAGYAFAQQNCAECHAVKRGQTESPNQDAPSFESVAKTKGMTGRALVVWLQTSHPTMPNFLISKKDRDDVVAYILTLKPEPTH
jgi:mono/diheme cytochrome c family protein